MSTFQVAIATALYCLEGVRQALEYDADNIDEKELPQGYLNPSMTEHFNQELQDAFEEKRVSVICLKSRDPNSPAVTAHGSTGQIGGSVATLELSPELMLLDAKATEWRAAVAVGGLSPNHGGINTLIKTAAVATAALLCYVCAPTQIFFTAFIAIQSGKLARNLLEKRDTANGELFANRILSQDQLAGGIRHLCAQQNAEKAMRMLLEERAPVLGHLYSLPNGDSYLPFNKLSDQIEEAKAAYTSRFKESYEPTGEEVATLSQLILNDLLENSWAGYLVAA